MHHPPHPYLGMGLCGMRGVGMPHRSWEDVMKVRVSPTLIWSGQQFVFLGPASSILSPERDLSTVLKLFFASRVSQSYSFFSSQKWDSIGSLKTEVRSCMALNRDYLSSSHSIQSPKQEQGTQRNLTSCWPMWKKCTALRKRKLSTLYIKLALLVTASSFATQITESLILKQIQSVIVCLQLVIVCTSELLCRFIRQ